MAELLKTFDFDIQPSATHVSGNIPPNGEAEVTFQVCNTGDSRRRAEAILEPIEGPHPASGLPVMPQEWAYWLQLIEPPEYDYQPQSVHTYTAKIRVGGLVTPGTYSFRLLLVGHDDPDHECLASDTVSFNVTIPPRSTRWLVIGLIALIALVLIGGIIAVRLITPPGGLDISFDYDAAAAEVGILKPYTLEMTNKLGDSSTKNVVMEYIYPEGVEGAWANVNFTNPTEPVVTRCGATGTMLRCVLEEIAPHQTATLTIYILPGPIPEQNAEPTQDPTKKAEQPGEIDNRFNLYWTVNKLPYNAEMAAKTTVEDKKREPVSGAALPVVDAVTVGLPVRISLIGWNNNKMDGPVELKYSLPKGMHFAGYDPGCKQEPGDYFTLVCRGNGQVEFNALVIPMQPSTGYDQTLQGRESESVDYQPLDTGKTISLSAANNPLVLNGMNEWVQLGTNSLPTKFTVTMWVNPDSLEDDQALIGIHHQSIDDKKVINKFLVGYYNGSISVEVMGEYHLLDLIKTTEPFHLAIVVDSGEREDNKPIVKAYKNGTPLEWKDPTKTCRNSQCLFNEKITSPKEGERDFSWVIGQDWDANGSEIVTSDFFHGVVNDVRIFGSALTIEQIAENMYLPLHCVEEESVIQDQRSASIQVQPPVCYDSKYDETNSQANKYSLIGWWPLAPINLTVEDLQADCLLPMQGNLAKAKAQCTLVDLGPNSYNGARSGGTWESEFADFGDALTFNGNSVVYLNNILLSDFTEKHTTVINAKATPTPTRSIVVDTLTPIPTPSSNKPTNMPALIGTEKALEATQTALAATQMALVATQAATPTLTTIPTKSSAPSEPGGVPVTIAAWVYIDTVPSQQQTILALDNEKARIRLTIASDGHVQVLYEKNGSNTWAVKDEKSIPAGRWIHYAVVFWFDKDTGTLTQDDKYIPMLLLFRDGQRVKKNPTSTSSTNLALNKPATASASCNSSEGPAKAVNGSWTAGLGDKWCDSSSSKWWQVDLGANFEINQFVVRHAGAGGESTTFNTTDFDIEVSTDGVNWTKVVEMRGNNANTTTHNIATATARYVRLSVLTEVARIYEVEVYGAGIPAGLHLGGLKTVVDGIVKVMEGFSGRIDEVRIWNRAMYNPVNNPSYTSSQIDFWRRLPGVAFDEYVYWSFDNHVGTQAKGLCQNKACNPIDNFTLSIIGPSWFPNDLSIDYTE